MHNVPKCFSLYLGAENVIFNEKTLMDVMYTDQSFILLIVDETTHFSAAKLLPGVSTKQIWKRLMNVSACAISILEYQSEI